MQREIEEAGISTITLSGIPDLTAAVGVPRLAAIEHPLGYLLGQPGNREGQLAVLRSTLGALAGINRPGSIVHLPYEWPESAKKLNADPAEPPPIARYLLKHPWHLRNLISREIPGEKSCDQKVALNAITNSQMKGIQS